MEGGAVTDGDGERLTILDRKDLASIVRRQQSQERSIANLDRCVERDSRDIVTINGILERQQRTIDLMMLATAFSLMLGVVSMTVMTLVMA